MDGPRPVQLALRRVLTAWLFCALWAAMAVVLSPQAHHEGPVLTVLAWCTVLYSLWPLWGLSLGLMLPVARRRVWLLRAWLLQGSVWLLAAPFLAWHAASLATWVDQRQVFDYRQIVFLQQDGLLWALLWEELLRPLHLLGLAAVLGVWLCLQWACAYLRLRAVAWGLVFLGTGMGAGGLTLWLAPAWVQGSLEGAASPWTVSEAIRFAQNNPLQISELWRLRRSDSPLWVPRHQPSPLSDLHGRWPGRSAVVIILESHRRADIQPGGIPGQQYSPILGQLLQEGVAFEAMYQAGLGTWSAVNTLLSGAWASTRIDKPAVSASGPSQAFRDLGYTLRWIQGTPTSFADFTHHADLCGFDAHLDARLQEQLERESSFPWSQWGMPDAALLQYAQQEIGQQLASGQPSLTVILTVSNHHPFALPKALPDGTPLSKDHQGGMRYADWALGQFVRWWRSLAPDQRPLLFITADTGYDDRKGPLPLDLDLSAVRIPGLLLGPEPVPPRTVTEPFAHADILDLLAYCLGLEHPALRSERLATQTRIGVPLAVAPDQWMACTAAGIWAEGQWWVRHDWNLSASQEPHEQFKKLLDSLQADVLALRPPLPGVR